MPKEDWGFLNEKAFEAALQASVPERLPDKAAAVTPWKRAMGRVLTGTALTALGTNLWGLNYLLPGIGLVLMLLGFRLLWRENRWFRCCFLLTGMQLAYCVFQLILQATPYQAAYAASTVGLVLPYLNALLQLFCLWRGLLAVQREAGLPPHTKGAAALVVWYLLLFLLAFTGFGAEPAALVMLAAYVLILCSIRRIYRELDETGYAVKPTGIRVPDWCIAAGLAVHLLELGFPDYVLQDLRREEIEACRGAIQVVVSVQEFDQKGGFCRSSGSNPLCITGVRVKLTGEPAGWMIFHHSLWNTAPPFHGTAAIQLCRYTSRMSCGAPPERSPAGFCTIGTGRPSGRPTTLWRRIPPPTDIRASMDSGTFSGHFLCPLRRSTGGAMWSMPPMKFLTQNTEMCRIAGSITAIRTDFCNTRQKRHWKTGCPIMGHFGPSGAICTTAPK